MKIRRKITNCVRKIEALQKKVTESETEPEELTEEAVAEEDELSDEQRDAIEKEIERLPKEADDLWEKCKEHSEATKYGHYLQLHIGLTSFYNALDKYLSPSSKRPRGLLEFVLNKSIELFSGAFMAEHSGFEQTNGRALKSLEKFKEIASVCVASYESTHPLHNQVKERFAEYEVVAEKLYTLCKLMKSQKKLSCEEFDAAVAHFIDAWNTTFPNVPYFNKLHFVMVHLPLFVKEYGFCGRASGESHESVHARIARIKACIKRMSSSTQMGCTLFVIATSNLQCNNNQKTNRHKKWEIQREKKSKLQDDVDMVSAY